MSSLTSEAYAVIEGRHSDPFRYLGPHVEDDVPLVRVFLPDAEDVAVVDDQGHTSDLQRIHDAGLFEGRLANGARRYRVRVRYGERQLELADLPEPHVGALRELTALARREAQLGRRERELRALLALLRERERERPARCFTG